MSVTIDAAIKNIGICSFNCFVTLNKCKYTFYCCLTQFGVVIVFEHGILLISLLLKVDIFY